MKAALGHVWSSTFWNEKERESGTVRGIFNEKRKTMSARMVHCSVSLRKNLSMCKGMYTI